MESEEAEALAELAAGLEELSESPLLQLAKDRQRAAATITADRFQLIMINTLTIGV